MRYTRASVPEDKLYLASTAVLMSEVLKTLVCLVVVYTLLPTHKKTIPKLATFLYHELIVNWRETVKLALPAILYLIQNNLQYVAATNLDAATFQVTYQLKILTTAFFSVVILKRKLSTRKWIALAILTAGIALVVMPKGEKKIIATEQETSIGNQSNAKGLLSVFTACILSGIAGVYFEKIVKTATKEVDLEKDKNYDSEQAIKTQLWIRNIQLSLFSVILGCIFVVGLQDGTKIIQDGFFQNYSYLTWMVILIQAGGGLIVGLVVRYADNILKGFATSISIILSSFISFWLFNFEITVTFGIGALLVVYATYMYGSSS
ncbi:UDP-galactose transporter [Mucor mucedo]|uniref:UDP-galactose transporter n=1 Tax=Mucor mucedo TaxID=29922 RepID=UPI00221FFD3A|nr:UDP-galactose transporter [Mucor mucedo]KAI7895246.1 UDP-galactose transporter [Mucor mucedo]